MIIPAELEGETEQQFRARMAAFIKEHFSGILGEHTALLDAPDGLQRLHELVRSGQLGVLRQARKDAA